VQSGTKQDYAGLDLIRFFAAASVMVYHLGYWDWVQPDAAGAPYKEAFSPAFPIMSAAWVGVPIFFVLSGFVISLSAMGRSPFSFVTSRILRLYPGAWLCGLVLIAFYAFQGDVAGLLERVVRSMTLWPIGPWLSDVYWTLAIEISFYALFFLGMTLGSRDVGIKIAWLLTLSNIAYLLARIVDRLAGGHFSDALNFFQSPRGSLFLLSRGCYFAFGIALWARSTQGWTRSIVALTACSAITASIYLTLEAMYLVHRSALPQWWLVGPVAIWMLAVASQIYATSANNVFKGMSPALRRRVKLLGLMTYPLYLLHANVGDAIMLTLTDAPPIASLFAAIVILLVLCLAIVRAETHVRRGLSQLLHARNRPKTLVSQLP
jgi:exopolysaccharide production protein ExoZ